MYIAEIVEKELMNVVGWRQNYNTQKYRIAESLTRSITKRYYQDVHPLITLDNIKNNAPEFEKITFSEWDEEINYRELDRVTIGNTTYRALKSNIGLSPIEYPDIWELYDSFSEYLENITKSSIIKVIDHIYNSKIASKTAKDLLENRVLFDGAGLISDTIDKTNSIVGFEIVPIRAKGITVRIEKIGLQFKGTGKIKLYLMHSSQVEPVKEIELTKTKSGSMEWYKMEDLFLNYISEYNDAGGSWFLCYDEKQLNGLEAINKNKDWSTEPCKYCNDFERLNWNAITRYMEIYPFKSKLDAEEMEMWPIDQNIHTMTTNYGINLQMSIFCDLTEIIEENKTMFAEAIGLQTAIDIIERFVHNPDFRINREQNNPSITTMQLNYILDGDSESYKKSGLRWSLSKAIETIDISLTGLNKICLPCEDIGINIRTI